jgi:DNA-binding GntR family transcriptional regulator
MSIIKRSPSLTDQAKAHIKEQILTDQYEHGRIPSESDLADELGVSRTTIRDALSRLENEGTVYRKQGSGTFVNEHGLQIKSRLDEIWSYEEILRAHGYTPSTEVLDVLVKEPEEEVRQALDLAEGETVTIIQKLFVEDANPIIFMENQIPTRICDGTYSTADYCRPVFELLEDRCRHRLNYYLSEIVPVSANKNLSQTLAIPIRKPLISLEEIGYNDENEPILWARSFFRDDLLRFRLIRRGVL